MCNPSETLANAHIITTAYAYSTEINTGLSYERELAMHNACVEAIKEDAIEESIALLQHEIRKLSETAYRLYAALSN